MITSLFVMLILLQEALTNLLVPPLAEVCVQEVGILAPLGLLLLLRILAVQEHLGGVEVDLRGLLHWQGCFGWALCMTRLRGAVATSGI